MAQHRRTLRQSLRSALANKKLADDLIDSIQQTQTRMTALFTAMDGGAGGDYATDVAGANLLDPDAEMTEGQNKSSQRRSLRSALAHKALADDILDSLEELDLSINGVSAQLTTDAGVPTAAAYAAFAVTEDEADSLVPEEDAQNKTSRRKILRSSLSHKRLADQLIDALQQMQQEMNLSVTDLDGGTLSAGRSVDTIDPDTE